MKWAQVERHGFPYRSTTQTISKQIIKIFFSDFFISASTVLLCEGAAVPPDLLPSLPWGGRARAPPRRGQPRLRLRGGPGRGSKRDRAHVQAGAAQDGRGGRKCCTVCEFLKLCALCAVLQLG